MDVARRQLDAAPAIGAETPSRFPHFNMNGENVF
jgi:hypothetical protein